MESNSYMEISYPQDEPPISETEENEETEETKETEETEETEEISLFSTYLDAVKPLSRAQESTEDLKRSGRPKEVIIPEIIRQVRQIVLTDRRVKVREIAETVSISTGAAVSILHDHLHMKKLNVKWVPHFLDIEQREKRVADSKSCLDMFYRNPSEFLRRYITMDETWIHHYIPESNRSSADGLSLTDCTAESKVSLEPRQRYVASSESYI
ncbi:hypothetical protein ACLKA6_009064 [Drosophila palustris]